MRLRNVAALYPARLRGRAAQELLAIAGIAIGVSLLFAALVANTSVTGSFDQLTRDIAGDARLQLNARGSQTLSEDLLRVAHRLPGVAEAAATLEVRGEALGPGGRRSVTVIGVNPEWTAIGSSLGRGFSSEALGRARAIGLPAPLADSLGLMLGHDLALSLGGRRVMARFGARLPTSAIGALVDSPVAIAPLRYAQELTGRPARLSRIVVVPEPGQEEAVESGLRRLAAGRADVLPATFDAAVLRQLVLPASQSTVMFSVFGAIVGFLFAFSGMLLTVPQRRRLIADLHVEGYGTATAAKILIFDALVLGIVGSALGVAIGDQVSSHLFDEPPDFIRYAFAITPNRVVSVEDVVIAVVGGIVASLVAVLVPTLPALRRPDGDARPTESRRRAGAGIAGAVGFLALGGAIIVADPTSAAIAIAGLACLIVSMLLVLPSLIRLVVNGLETSTRQIRSVVPFMAVFGLRDPAGHARSLAVAATGAVAVFGSLALQGAHADLLRGLDRTAADVAEMGDLWALAPGDANLLVTEPFRASALPSQPPAGIARLAVYRGALLDIGDRRVRVFGPPPGRDPLAHAELSEGDRRNARARLAEGGWIVVSEGIAREQGLAVGDRFTLRSPVPRTFRIAAITTNLGWPPGSIVLNADDYAHAWGGDDATAILATLAPGTSPAAGERALRAALGSRSTLSVQTAATRLRVQQRSARAGVERLAQIAALVLIAAVVAMASAMAGLMWQRRPLLVDLKVEGYGTSALWQGLLLEAAILIGSGCIIGAAFGLLGQGLLSRALTSVTGFPVVYSPAVTGAVLICMAVTIASLAIVAAFGRRVAGVTPGAAWAE